MFEKIVDGLTKILGLGFIAAALWTFWCLSSYVTRDRFNWLTCGGSVTIMAIGILSGLIIVRYGKSIR